MKNPFLRAKHWQIFLLIMVFPLSTMLLFSTSNFENIQLIQAQYYSFFLALIVLISWGFSAGLGLLKYIPEDLRPNSRWFKIAASLPLIFGVFYFPEIVMSEKFNPFTEQGELLFLTQVIPMGFLSVFSILYCCFFISRNIYLAEKKKKYEPFDFILSTMFVYFLPLSIWYLQPKINKAIQESK